MIGQTEPFRNCEECKWETLQPNRYPCCDCDGGKWEPKEKPMTHEADTVTYESAPFLGADWVADYYKRIEDALLCKDSDNNWNKHDTGIETKRENYSVFSKLVSNQFWHGGEKYKLAENKEFTDVICEVFPGESGVDWVLGTCMKYLGRYKNFGREKDLLKVATYMYILWLKGGFHLEEHHDEDTKKDGSSTNE